MPPQLLQIEQCKSRIFTFDGHEKTISTKLLEFFETKEFCDITLIAEIGGFKLEAHRMVLAASSGYFDQLFRSTMNGPKFTEFELKHFDEELMTTIVKFMYKPEIELKLETVETVLWAACFLEMNSLVVACCSFMADQMDIDKCIRLMIFAERFNCSELYKKALEYANNYFELVCKRPEFHDLTAEQVNQFIASDNICVRSEKSVLKCLLSWVNHDKVHRESQGAGLLKCIRFPLLKPSYLAQTVRTLSQNPEWGMVMSDWFRYFMSPEIQAQFPDKISTPRRKYRKYKLDYDGEDNDGTICRFPLKRRRLSPEDSADFHMRCVLTYLRWIGLDFSNCIRMTGLLPHTRRF